MAVLRIQGDFLSVILMIFLKKWFFIWNRGLRPSMDRKSLQESEFHCKNTRGAPYDLEIWKIMKNITRHPRLHMNTPGPNEKIFPDRWIEYMDVSGPHPAPRFVWRAPKESDSLSSARRVIYLAAVKWCEALSLSFHLSTFSPKPSPRGKVASDQVQHLNQTWAFSARIFSVE